MDEQRENLDSLLKSLYGEEAAEAVKEDIRLGDEILNSHPSPEPDAAVVEEIKSNVLAALANRKRVHRRVSAYRSVVAAALLLIITGLGVRFMTYQETPYAGSEIAIEDIDTADFFGGDLQLAMLADEVDEIESSILSVSLDESFSDPELDMDEIEMEILEVSSSLWRGL